jgi:proline racemase
LLLTGETYKNAGPLGTTFDARVVRETKIGDLDGVEVEIRGAAYITGIHEYVVDAGDPLPEGYLL